MLKVDTVCMETQAQKMKEIASRLHQICSDLSTVSQRLRWKTGVDYQVRRSLNASNSAVEGMANKAATLEQTLNQAIIEYTNAENSAQKGDDGGLGFFPGDCEPIPIVGPCGDVKHLDDSSDSGGKFDTELPAWLQPLLKWLDKTDSSDEAGVLDKGLGYLDSLKDLFSGDMGVDEYLDLCDKSVGLWTELYNYLKKLYNGKEGIFSERNQTKVDIADLGGDILGFISALWGANETIDNSPNMGTVGKIGEYIGTGDNLTDLAKDALEKILGKDHDLTKKDGVYSPLAIYTAIVKGGVEAISQAFTSVDKYSADGSWSTDDTGSTGIDASMAGMYGITHALTFGMDDAIFGLVDNISGGSKNDDLSYAEKAAEGYKYLANEMGEAIANWWMSITD